MFINLSSIDLSLKIPVLIQPESNLSPRRDEWSTVRVSNVPKGTQRVEFEKVFEDFGPVKKSWILDGMSCRLTICC